VRTDEARVVLRPRGGLEAVDLGFAMARAWWRPLASTWLGLVFPFAGVLIVALREHPNWTVLLLWWLRPLFARVPLHVLGGALFGEPVGLRETARALPRLLRGGILTALVTQRFSPARTFLLPVLQLEGLRGAARRARCVVLARRDLGSAMGLVAVGAHLNACILFGLLAALAIFLPDAVGLGVIDLFSPLTDDRANEALGMLVPALYLAGTSVVEPLLVAGGFGLYVNRRVDLEAWDIDLAFRRLARRATAAASAAALAGALLLAPGPAHAAPGTLCVADEPRSAASCVRVVLAGDDFRTTREVEWWRPRSDLFDFDGNGFELPDLGWLGELIATLGEMLLWLGIAIAVIVLLVTLAGARSAPARSRRRIVSPGQLFGLDLDPKSLPDDLVGAARVAWARGAHSEALCLLYRGALLALVESGGLAIPDSATELECVRLVRASARAASAGALQTLTNTWLRTRYAGAPPGDAVFDGLCSSFEHSFARSVAPDPGQAS